MPRPPERSPAMRPFASTSCPTYLRSPDSSSLYEWVYATTSTSPGISAVSAPPMSACTIRSPSASCTSWCAISTRFTRLVAHREYELAEDARDLAVLLKAVSRARGDDLSDERVPDLCDRVDDDRLHSRLRAVADVLDHLLAVRPARLLSR